jgi:hypothetical protein
MVNYENSKIYKVEPIVEHPEEDIYIGSTTKKYLSQRMDTHRGDYKRWKDGKRDKIMSFNLFDKYGVDNCQIILLETVNANSKDELIAREAYYIKTLKCVNRCIPGRTVKEYYNDNKKEITEKRKQYRINNKNEILEYQKQYYNNKKQEITQKRKIKIHCDICDCDTTKHHIAKHNKSPKHLSNLQK